MDAGHTLSGFSTIAGQQVVQVVNLSPEWRITYYKAPSLGSETLVYTTEYREGAAGS